MSNQITIEFVNQLNDELKQKLNLNKDDSEYDADEWCLLKLNNDSIGRLSIRYDKNNSIRICRLWINKNYRNQGLSWEFTKLVYKKLLEKKPREITSFCNDITRKIAKKYGFNFDWDHQENCTNEHVYYVHTSQQLKSKDG